MYPAAGHLVADRDTKQFCGTGDTGTQYFPCKFAWDCKWQDLLLFKKDSTGKQA